MITVNFELDLDLQEALKSFREVDAPTRALIVTVNNEKMRLYGLPLEATSSMEDDLAKVRNIIVKANMGAAYVIVRLNEGKFAQVTFCSDGVKPKEKMIYASGAGHLADASGLGRVVKEHAVCVDDITPSLFAEEAPDNRVELMTEEEKLRVAMDRLELAPMPVIMPGVTMPLSDSGIEVLQKFSSGELSAVVFAVEADKITVDNTLNVSSDTSSSLLSLADAVKALLPKDHPRFVVLRFLPDETATAATKVVMMFICPAACKPREKITYASSKSSFLLQAEQHGVKFARRLEISDTDEVGDAVVDAFADDGDDKDEKKPEPPKFIVSKGQRMLI